MYLDVTETANIVRFPLIKQFSKPSAFGRLCNDDYSKRPICRTVCLLCMALFLHF